MRRAPVVWIGAAATLVFAFLVVVDGSRSVDIRITDPTYVVRGAHVAVDCLRDGTLHDCGHGLADEVGAWPLSQYVAAVPLAAAGVSELGSLTVLSVLAALATLGMALLTAFPVRGLLGTEWAVVLAVALLTGPFVLYGLLPFGEAVAAFLALAFVVAACDRSWLALLALGLLAGITKETAAPFLAVLGVLCARGPDDGWLPPRRVTLAILGGVGTAVVCNALFNLFRFGDLTNLVYNQPKTRVPGVERRFRLAVADWFAPNVGVLWFWFLAAVVLGGLVIATVVLVTRSPRRPRAWAPPLTVIGLVAVFTAGLASWYSTFGWLAWGPRLTLGFLPAFMVAGIWVARDPMTSGLHWVTRHAGALIALTAVTVVLGFANAGVVWNQAAIDLPLDTDAQGPRVLPIERTTPEVFYGCGLHEAWRLRPLSLWEASGHGPVTQHVAQLFQAAAVVCAAVWLRRRAGAPRREPATTLSGERRGAARSSFSMLR
jgi:hypothetical protein